MYGHMVAEDDVNKMMAKLVAWSGGWSGAEEGEFHITCEDDNCVVESYQGGFRCGYHDRIETHEFRDPWKCRAVLQLEWNRDEISEGRSAKQVNELIQRYLWWKRSSTATALALQKRSIIPALLSEALATLDRETPRLCSAKNELYAEHGRILPILPIELVVLKNCCEMGEDIKFALVAECGGGFGRSSAIRFAESTMSYPGTDPEDIRCGASCSFTKVLGPMKIDPVQEQQFHSSAAALFSGVVTWLNPPSWILSGSLRASLDDY